MLSQVLDHYNEILEALKSKQNSDVIYTDFATEIFEKCDYDVLAHEMLKMGITGKW